MATKCGIGRLRICRIPLLIVMLISGCMILRVPLAAMTTGGEQVAAKDKKANKGKARQTKRKQANQQQPKNHPQAPLEIPGTVQLVPAEPRGEEFHVDVPPISSEPLADTGAVFGSQTARLANLAGEIPRLVGAAANQSSGETPAHVEPAGDIESPGPVPNPPTPPTPPATEVVLRNPADSGGTIHFVIGSKRHSLAAGEELRLPAGEQVRLRFHRGGEFGVADEPISTPGEYLLTPTRNGWILQHSIAR